MNSLSSKLEKIFNLQSFREPQLKVIKGALKGYDQIIILPTGTGKSLCYQFTAMITDGVTIVISPFASAVTTLLA